MALHGSREPATPSPQRPAARCGEGRGDGARRRVARAMRASGPRSSCAVRARFATRARGGGLHNRRIPRSMQPTLRAAREGVAKHARFVAIRARECVARRSRRARRLARSLASATPLPGRVSTPSAIRRRSRRSRPDRPPSLPWPHGAASSDGATSPRDPGNEGMRYGGAAGVCGRPRAREGVAKHGLGAPARAPGGRLEAAACDAPRGAPGDSARCEHGPSPIVVSGRPGPRSPWRADRAPLRPTSGRSRRGRAG
jgi:hypothetical protein